MQQTHDRRTAIQRRLLRWFRHYGRSLPWRRTKDPYRILVSEVMLQQTQVARVVPMYRRWLRKFPNIETLAKANGAAVLRAWSGLGYNTRAIRLRNLAKIVMRENRGKLPRDADALRRLPGIGSYTAAAVCVFAYGGHHAMVDTNIRRVIGRCWYGQREMTKKKLMRASQALIPEHRSWEWHQALMDLGAMVCSARKPKCRLCPLQRVCTSFTLTPEHTWKTARTKVGDRFYGSDRYWRGWIVRTMLKQSRTKNQQWNVATKHNKIPKERFQRILQALKRDGVIQLGRSITLVQ